MTGARFSRPRRAGAPPAVSARFSGSTPGPPAAERATAERPQRRGSTSSTLSAGAFTVCGRSSAYGRRVSGAMENRAAVFTSQPQAVEVYQAGAWWAGELLGWRHDSNGSCQVWVRVVLGGVEETAWTDLTTLRLPERHLTVAQPAAAYAPATQEMSVARHPSGRRARSADTDQVTAGLPLVRDLAAVPDLPSTGGRRTAEETAQFASVGRRRAPEATASPSGGRRRAPETGESPSVGRRRAPENVATAVAPSAATPSTAAPVLRPRVLRPRVRRAGTGQPGNRCTRRTRRTRRPWPPPHRGHGASPRRQRPGRAPDRGPVAAARAPRSPQRAAGAPAASRGRLRTGPRGLDRPGRRGAGAAHPAHAAERPCAARPPSPCRRVRRQRLSDRMDACRASGARTSTGAAVRPRRLSARRPCGVLSRAPVGARGSAGPKSPRCLGTSATLVRQSRPRRLPWRLGARLGRVAAACRVTRGERCSSW